LGAGVGGAAIGRNVFESASPGTVARDLADVIHSSYEPLEKYDETMLAGPARRR
jgi:DhnA family fructose-bisphosphate aldolase class Ia